MIPEYTEGICGDGAAILKDGVMMTIPEILNELNSITEIEGLKKENERLVAFLKKLYYAGFGGILISLDYDENIRQTEIDKHWQSFAKANNIKL